MCASRDAGWCDCINPDDCNGCETDHAKEIVILKEDVEKLTRKNIFLQHELSRAGEKIEFLR
jgi:hypothetical protein